MIIKPLEGKYYGTELVEDRGPLAGMSVKLWKNTGTPSDRQLAKWGLTFQQWSDNALIDDGWGEKVGVRESDYLSDGHYESAETYDFALRVCLMANKSASGPSPAAGDGYAGRNGSEVSP